MNTNTTRRTLLIASIASALPTVARAQESFWPSRPIRIVVPGTAGSIVDIRARWLAQRLAPGLGQAIVVDNKPGAGGNIAMAEIARSAADGYTVAAVHQGTMAINPHLYARPGYDPIADFTPLTRLGIGPLLLAVHPDLPARSVAELVQLAKFKPRALKYGTPGIGTPPHLASELFLRMAGIEATHIPYKGGADAQRDLVAGHLSWTIEGIQLQMPQVKAERLRALGVTGTQRSAVLPDVPTIAEAGVPGYEYVGWVGLALPAATPQPIVLRLHEEIAKVLGSAEAREWFAAAGIEPGLEAPEAFAAVIRSEHAKWGKLIREAGIKAE